MSARASASTLVLASLLLLAGCGSAPSGSPPARSASAPSSAATSAEATAPPVGDGAPHELENSRYRDRAPIAAASVPVLVAARSRVLRALRDEGGAPTESGVRAVLESVGAADGGSWVARDAATGGVSFETQVGRAGCLVGRITAAGDAAADPAGFVLDGGCHALNGH